MIDVSNPLNLMVFGFKPGETQGGEHQCDRKDDKIDDE